MNRLLTNSPGNDLPVVSIVIVLFLFATVYYALFFTAFNLPLKTSGILCYNNNIIDYNFINIKILLNFFQYI